MAKKTYTVIERNGHKYNLLALPDTNFFKFEIINLWGSNIERLYETKFGKNVYGISHFIEHLGFRNPKDFSTAELLNHLKNDGTYNASTDYDRINYWFQTTMDRVDLAIKLVANYALNTLDNIPSDEFEIEKKVVYNEAKRYADDDQTMFWFNSTRALTGYKEEDNIIGIPETIDTFEIDDCIRIKDLFLSNAQNIFNVTYDPSILTANEVIDKIELELHRHKPLGIMDKISEEEYKGVVIQPKHIKTTLSNESEQHITYLNFDIVENIEVARAGNQYLARYAEGTSLDDVIREQNGLTYGITLGAANISYKPYTYFGCDVSKGDEELLLKLFKESINASVDAWNEKTHKKFMDAKKLKRVMNLLDQKNYGGWHNNGTWYPEIIEEMKEVLATDLDNAYEVADEKYATVERVRDYLEKFRKAVNEDDFALVTN